MMNKAIPIRSIEHLNGTYFVITIDLGSTANEVQAGQFFQIKPAIGSVSLLKKPISVYDVKGTEIKLMIKTVGNATEQLSKLLSGDRLDVTGPLGNGFPLAEKKSVVLVSGGIGYPPLFFLKKNLLELNSEVYWLHGGHSKGDMFAADEMWTDDGSKGKKGLVTTGLAALLEYRKPDIIYACGPKAMLKACHQLTSEQNIPLYVSLEEYMACGIGVCHGCAVKVRTEDAIGTTYKTVCKDGPVFNAKDIVWESM
jgi:dihydroorotate dehydrogenase electron transfer subunit